MNAYIYFNMILVQLMAYGCIKVCMKPFAYLCHFVNVSFSPP